MTHNLKYFAVIILLLAVYASYLVLQPAPQIQRTAVQIQQESPWYHGADLLKIGWKGEITAYKWERGKYILMWTRKNKV